MVKQLPRPVLVSNTTLKTRKISEFFKKHLSISNIDRFEKKNHGAFLSISNSVLCIDRQNEQRNSVDTMYDLLNELVKQIATATEGNYTNM